MVEGQAFDNEIVRRDINEVVEAYSPLGLLFDPTGRSPDTLQVTAQPVFRLEPGKLELRYQINEGRPYRVGDILVRGNGRTLDKVAIRELRLAPGDLYDSAKIETARRRLQSLPAFDTATITPLGDGPDERDLLIDIEEGQTGFLNFGVGVNSNGGFGGNITYTQRNFDAFDFPSRPGEIFTGDAFVGAGQTFRASFEPGSEATNASVRFVEPYLFDQPYVLTLEGYVRDRQRLEYDIRRGGGRVSIGKFLDEDRIYSLSGTFRAENVQIMDIRDKEIRSQQILDAEGDTFLTSLGVTFKRDTRDNPFIPSSGSEFEASWESFGALGGDDTFQRFIGTYSVFYTLSEDLRDRKVVLSFVGDAGFIAGDAPIYERFYEGGIGSLRGFAFRGVTVRDGPDDDRVGGEFTLTGTAQVGFPLYQEQLRGVTFLDVGTVLDSPGLEDIRVSAGAGIRWAIPLFGEIPVAIDFAFPLAAEDEDSEQVVSFSLGVAQ
jgi:outer membrane protein insertion porin family